MHGVQCSTELSTLVYITDCNISIDWLKLNQEGYMISRVV